MSVRVEPLPDRALLGRYRETAYTDCFSARIGPVIELSDLIQAFYTTPVFRLERFILARFGYGATDDDVRRLAQGEADRFAAWTVEDRSDDQLLLRDVTGRTRSWLMVAPVADGTRLYFGSAVVSGSSSGGGLLLAFHKVYSRVLLASARRRLA